MSESEWKTVSFALYTLVVGFFSSLIASIYPSCLWGFLQGLKATEWLAMRFLMVCACWCCWGDSMGHEWLELRQRRAESAWGGCAVHHNVQQVRWGCFSRDVNSFQEWKTSNIILLFFIWLVCCALELRNTDVEDCIFSTLHTSFRVHDPLWLTENRSHSMTCAKVCKHESERWFSIEHCVLPIATHWEIHLSDSTGFHRLACTQRS